MLLKCTLIMQCISQYDAVAGASFLASHTELPWRESRTVQAKSIESVLQELIHIQSVTGRSYATVSIVSYYLK